MAEEKPKKTRNSLIPRRYKAMDDYDLRVQLDARGRERREPVYKGPYFLPQHSDEVYRNFRIAVIVCAVLILAATFAILFFDTFAVYKYEGLYTLIPLTLALFPFAYMLMGFFRMPRKNGRMQRDVYARTIRRIRHSALAIAILAGLSLILWGVFLIAIRGQGLEWWDALYTGAILLILALGLFLFFYEKKLSFTVENAESPHELQDAMNGRSED